MYGKRRNAESNQLAKTTQSSAAAFRFVSHISYNCKPIENASQYGLISIDLDGKTYLKLDFLKVRFPSSLFSFRRENECREKVWSASGKST